MKTTTSSFAESRSAFGQQLSGGKKAVHTETRGENILIFRLFTYGQVIGQAKLLVAIGACAMSNLGLVLSSSRRSGTCRRFAV